jgi:hypothetical protein
MSLRDAFAGLSSEPEDSGTQVPKRSGAGERRVSAKGGAPTRKGAAELERPPLPLQGTAKSKHPDFEAVKVYLRSTTHKLARRKCEDEGQGDFSDLVESLLQRYLGA